MTLQVHVEGGTGAGKRAPMAAASVEPWRCGCPRSAELRPASWRNCPYCGKRRPPK